QPQVAAVFLGPVLIVATQITDDKAAAVVHQGCRIQKDVCRAGHMVQHHVCDDQVEGVAACQNRIRDPFNQVHVVQALVNAGASSLGEHVLAVVQANHMLEQLGQHRQKA